MIDHFFNFPRWNPVEQLSVEMEEEGGGYISEPKPFPLKDDIMAQATSTLFG